jgi:hypothetical protein
VYVVREEENLLVNRYESLSSLRRLISTKTLMTHTLYCVQVIYFEINFTKFLINNPICHIAQIKDGTYLSFI